MKDAKLERIINGEAAVVGDAWLDSIADLPIASQIRTCHNRKQIGGLDRWVAWMHDDAAPKDLEQVGFIAIGSCDF
jgi:hypothetical protein